MRSFKKIAAVLCFAGSSVSAQDLPRVEAVLSGVITEVPRAEFVSIGSIPVRLRGVFVEEADAPRALEFMRALATGRETECRLTGERWAVDQATLVGECVVFDGTGGREIDLGARLLYNGLARACATPGAVIAIYPPVYPCD